MCTTSPVNFDEIVDQNQRNGGFKDTCHVCNGNSINTEKLLKYGLINPINVLNRSLKQSGLPGSNEPTKCELEEALLNAVRQLDRLKKYRISQQTRINQLQERLDHMGHELNSSVDTIRHHRNDYEAQKRRNYMEITDLRKQLAKTSALLGQFKLLFSKADLNNDCWSQNIRVFVGNSLKNLHTTNELQDIDTLSIDDLKLRLSIAENELTQLRSDMAHQREDADREASRLRGQLGEVNSDARTLRMQLNRLISQSKSPSELNGLKNKNSSDSPSCTNCQKLQRLNDILQRKQSKMNMFPDVINRQGNMMNHASIVCENSTFTQKAIHKPHVIDDLVQTDLLDDIPKTDLIQKVDIATDPIDGYNNASPYLPVESCKCIQTESFIVGGDVTLPETPVNGEVSFIGEALQYSIVHEPSMLSEVELNSVPVSDKCTRVSIIGNNNAPPVINDSRNSMLHSVYESKYDNLTSPSQSVSEDLSYSQLLQRLRRAEEEAIMAMDQLKSSNAEFLTLKERLSHATVERAHLKATISGLDEQVALLEDCLYERTQELHKCQARLGEYCPTYEKPAEPYCVGSEVSTSEISIKIHEPSDHFTSKSTIINLRGFQFYEPMKSFIRSSSIGSKCLHHSVKLNGWLSVLWKQFILHGQQLASRMSNTRQYTSFRLQSQPRPKVMLIFVIYFFFVHLLLLHCWLS